MIRPFISYAHEDMATALRLWRDLRSLGAEPWLDREELVAGQRWEDAVRDALDISTHFVALISARSISKRGFVQKELAQALELLKEFPPDSIYVIPVRLDDTRPKHRILRELHWVDLFRDYQAGVIEIAKSVGIAHPQVRVIGSLTRDAVSADVAVIIAAYARQQAGGDTAIENELLSVERDAWVRLQNIAPLDIRRSEVERILDEARRAFPNQFGNQLFRVLNDITRELAARSGGAPDRSRGATSAGTASDLSIIGSDGIPPLFRHTASETRCPRCSGLAIYETDDDPDHMMAAISCQACGYYTADGYE